MTVYITGTSSGIGKATALELLKEGFIVIGISRKCKIKHQNYKHIFLDLSNLNTLNQFDFEPNINDNIVLINNAGIINPIKPVGHLLDKDIINITTVNLLAPQILINKFIHKYNAFNNHYTILNISSGAGKHPIDAWATYCASKAGIDLFSETINLEFNNRKMDNWKIYSFAPGVVDTKMQEKIRNSNASEFKSLQKFLDLKKENQLLPSNKVATVIVDIVKNTNKYNKVVFSIRDL
jgi:benzil reductase ((S)-benzoin forming)